MSLTSRIQALTAYANEVTGKSDTNLSDAVASLADGYGSGGSFEGLQLVSVDQTTGRPTAYKWIGDTIPAYGLYYAYYGSGNGQRCTLDLDGVEYLSQYTLSNSGLEPINCQTIKEMDSYALSLRSPITGNDLRNKTLNLANYTGYGIDGKTTINSVLRSGDTDNFFGTILCPKIEFVPQYFLYNNRNDTTVQLGSVGHPVRSVGERPFGAMAGTNTVTVYTTGELLDSVKTKMENSKGSATTFIYKASENTTYNGTSYNAGDTILTSTPS